MNLLKTLTVAAMAAAMPTMASALNVIHITGSTAFRAPTTIAIINYCNTTGSCFAAFSNKSLLGGFSAIVANGTLGSGGTATTVFETNWTGSLAGVVDVATANPLAFPNEGNATNITAVNGGRVTALTGSGAGTVAGVLTAPASTNPQVTIVAPDACMSDAFASSAASALSTVQISGSITGGATTAAQLVSQINAAALQEAGSGAPIVGAGSSSGYLGIVPFQWVIGNLSGATAPTNITQQAASFLIKSGFVPLSMLSKTSTDSFSSADFAYLIGRNEDSGTRIDSFAEPQLGFIQNPHQYLLTFSGGSNESDLPPPTDFTQIGGTAAKVEGAALWPANAALNTEPNLNWAAAGGGHGGYAGGGDVASVLSTPVDEVNITGTFPGENQGNIYFIGYLGIADSGAFGNATSVPGGQALSYNGVVASTATINNGSYSFWSYEHMYYLPSLATTNATTKSTLDSIANSIASTFAEFNSSGADAPLTNAAGVKLSASGTAGTVKRTVEGGGFQLNY